MISTANLAPLPIAGCYHQANLTASVAVYTRTLIFSIQPWPCLATHLSASDSFTTMALYKSIYLLSNWLTYLLNYLLTYRLRRHNKQLEVQAEVVIKLYRWNQSHVKINRRTHTTRHVYDDWVWWKSPWARLWFKYMSTIIYHHDYIVLNVPYIRSWVNSFSLS